MARKFAQIAFTPAVKAMQEHYGSREIYARFEPTTSDSSLLLTLLSLQEHNLDPFFGPEGANAFQRDLKTIEVHLLNTGHFALDEEGEAMGMYSVRLSAAHIRRFLPLHIA